MILIGGEEGELERARLRHYYNVIISVRAERPLSSGTPTDACRPAPSCPAPFLCGL